jgi:hypothetical protein
LSNPLDELTTAVSTATGRMLADELRADPTGPRVVASHALESALVIAVDQFEEFVTLAGRTASG